MKIDSDNESVRSNPSDAALALAMGLASNALASSKSFFQSTQYSPGPAGERDRLGACLLTLGYLQEARRLLENEWPRVRALALRGGATADELKELREALKAIGIDGRLPQARNQLIFHWDRGPLERWASQFEGPNPCWLDSESDDYNSLRHALAFSAVMEILFEPVVESGPDDESRVELLTAWIGKLGIAVQAVIEIFARAVEGHIRPFRRCLDRRATAATGTAMNQGKFNFNPPEPESGGEQ